ncbi:hypothetical protein DS2_03180 [Catenovulum agarivorans DS-2]|uniref:Anti-sigma K factor RskA C-terminal domain-containing protein n=1 Tax=Catenovulum agarivorans DS-2 TaxID=1328313 RepID=W7QUE5_9ALTE|nr:anti-sigma factor [Catenovulum agarivorans]EWH11478.1 hypothetical protein DS2_03180 [Catenovulum agarivorans DS-2]
MKYDNDELMSYLAAEYVLGTLNGAARKRFARLLMTSSHAREATTQWERHLNALGTPLPHKVPNEEVWTKIQARIHGGKISLLTQARSDGNTQDNTKNNWFWPTISAISLAASLVLAILLMQPIQPVDQRFVSDQFALVKGKQQQSLWLIDVTSEQLIVKASDKLVARSDKDYELWMVVKTQEAPISLGLLPKSGTASLPVPQDFANGNIALLAVSLEPIGGSPTGSPTEVLYTAELIKI